jgi:serine/threonine-protein kinase
MVVGDVLADRFELEELVGTGGMSSVYRARDRVLDRPVALKVLHDHFVGDDEHVERFRREARAVASLSHPNIVTVIDRGEHDGSQFIVFEYVDGGNLKRVIDRAGPAPVDRALELAIQVARGLAYAHEQGLVHRDVKPQNVLLNGSGRAKVTDFGIARALDVRGMTQTGTVLGTSEYISPEQAQGRDVGELTDVYSLGVVLYELLTGELPFTGENFVAVAMRHINEPPPSVLEKRPEVPLRVAEAVDRALAKKPADRFPTMAAFADELTACLREVRFGEDGERTGVLAPPEPVRTSRPKARAAVPDPRPQRGRRRWPRRLLLLLVLLLVAAAVAVGVIALTRDDGQAGTSGGGGGGSGAAIALTGATAYDPYGSNHVEHNADAHYATDGNPSTYWSTETYRYPDGGLGKAGVGLVLDAGRSVSPGEITVTTDTPGFVARIQAGDSSGGPFHDVSDSQTVESRTTFTLHDAHGRYFVVWITNLGPHNQVHVNEVTAG